MSAPGSSQQREIPDRGHQHVSKPRNFEYVSYQRKLLNRVCNVGITPVKVVDNGSRPSGEKRYRLEGLSPLELILWLALHVNVLIKTVFLVFVVMDYFGPVEFLDKVATLDYFLCSGQVVILVIVMKKYPLYESIHALWTLLNSIYLKHGSPAKIMTDIDRLGRKILFVHLLLIFGGCGALMIQFFPDSKYINFTYSMFTVDNIPLRILFGIHEFFFMMMPWCGFAVPSTISIFQGVAITALLDRMNETVKLLFRDEMIVERVAAPGRAPKYKIRRHVISPGKTVPDTEYDIESLIMDYRKLMLSCVRFNESLAYITLYLHVCAGSQWISDVFAATHVLRMPGTGFMDVWFYLWDCMSAGFMMLRVYHFMGMVSDSSEIFIGTLKEYITFPNANRLRLRKLMRTLKLVTLNVGPCPVYPESLLAVMDTIGNYYVCAALWP